MTAIFGRPFSKLGVSSLNLYVTEVALLAIVVLALVRCGPRGAFDRIRRGIPIILLLLFWLAGAVATLTGLADFGLRRVVRDIGLVEYSVLLPIVAVVVDTRARARELLQWLIWTGIAAAIAFALVFWLDPYGGLGLTVNPAAAVAIYISLVALPVLARLGTGLEVRRVELVATAAGLVLMTLAVTRSALVALFAAAFVLAVLAPSGFRLRSLAVAAAAVLVPLGAALALQGAGIGVRDQPPGELPPSEIASPDFVADDGLTEFDGGELVTTDSAEGRASREVALGDSTEIPILGGLDDGVSYTITFSVKPLTPQPTTGIVGNNAGSGWKIARWKAKPTTEWQELETTLTATAGQERLVLAPDSGSGVLFDGLELRKGERVRSAHDDEEEPEDDPEGEGTTAPDSKVSDAFRQSFEGESRAGYGANARWRLAFWEHLVRGWADQPILGVGFGHPAAFRWKGLLYDGRRNPQDSIDVSPPHNSFLNVLYRTGLLGFIPFVLSRRSACSARCAGSSRPPTGPNARQAWGCSRFSRSSSRSLPSNAALEGPFMGIFFWAVARPAARPADARRGEPAHRSD